ncbi:hypothetical protein [Nonomuraea longicatena]|uniref:Uncharacterized protein n=1 Tax=Nonomuraea longicatena TaxID=83682 RepID=A0ABP3Z712_9ACTN
MSEPDLDTLPDVDVPDSLPEGGNLDTTVTLFTADVCLRFNGRSWKTLTVSAPGPDEIADLMNQYVLRLNAVLVSRGYPPGLATWGPGACP